MVILYTKLTPLLKQVFISLKVNNYGSNSFVKCVLWKKGNGTRVKEDVIFHTKMITFVSFDTSHISEV